MSTTIATAEPVDRKLIGLGAVVVVGTVLSIVDSTIVNAATRTLGQEFHTSIGPGKLADLVALAEDPHHTAAIADIPILATIVGGEVAHGVL